MKQRVTMIYCILVIFLALLFNDSLLSAEIHDNEIVQRVVIFQEAIYFGGNGDNAPVILSIVDGQRPEDGCSGTIYDLTIYTRNNNIYILIMAYVCYNFINHGDTLNTMCF